MAAREPGGSTVAGRFAETGSDHALDHHAMGGGDQKEAKTQMLRRRRIIPGSTRALRVAIGALAYGIFQDVAGEGAGHNTRDGTTQELDRIARSGRVCSPIRACFSVTRG